MENTLAHDSVDLAPEIRASLGAKLERLLHRPLIARVVGAPAAVSEPMQVGTPAVFLALASAMEALPSPRDAWCEDPSDGTCRVRIAIDYDDAWRGYEREICETVNNAVESPITLLTDAQRTLLERSPREFLALDPRPESVELVAFEVERVGGVERIVALRLAAPPESRAHIRHIAVVPNLVPLERQLDALRSAEAATDDSPIGPLRALIGLAGAATLAAAPVAESVDVSFLDERLDEHQRDCVRKATSTPHFAVIEGPPGSGKTTVITAIIRRYLARGEQVLVVSPTHVAVDNVVEKLVAPPANGGDRMELHTLPVRFAARAHKLSPVAQEYWLGAKKQRRGATIARRVERRLCAALPVAERLFALEDKEASGRAPLSAAIAAVETVICGTPIGILSHEAVKRAPAGAFGVLIVDEVSKMTLPEFLAVAVKARRWVVVGDPAQLPPFNNSEENGVTLDSLTPPVVELACSVGALLERTKPALRRDESLVVAAASPGLAAAAIRAHLEAVLPMDAPAVGVYDSTGRAAGVVVCAREDVEGACAAITDARSRGVGAAGVRVLVERGLTVPRPSFASGRRFVEPKDRASAAIFETAFNVYHAQPWARRSAQRLRFLGFRNGLQKSLPSPAVLSIASGGFDTRDAADEARGAVVDAFATRFAVNAISVYDWLTGISTADFDVSPLRELARLARPALQEAVRPHVGKLAKQYRMHASLSRVPRRLFYFDRALVDGRHDEQPGCRVRTVPVEADGPEGESNAREVEAIATLIGQAMRGSGASVPAAEIMVITPYREQEARLREKLGALANVEVCTLDRCQGREADYVFISLVRSRATPFFDMPRRWNVALTRAKEGLFLVGDIEAYLREAADARRDMTRAKPGETRPQMSLLARILEAYDREIRASRMGATNLG